jgi:cell division protein FtsL
MSRAPAKRPSGKSVRRLWPSRRALGSLALFLWLVGSAFGYVWCRVQVVRLGYQLSEAHRVYSRLLDDNKKLHLELARLRAPERVELIATQQLGLRRPSKGQIVVLP